jgi:membrane protein YdbS with pleckstrin-like domain
VGTHGDASRVELGVQVVELLLEPRSLDAHAQVAEAKLEEALGRPGCPRKSHWRGKEYGKPEVCATCVIWNVAAPVEGTGLLGEQLAGTFVAMDTEPAVAATGPPDVRARTLDPRVVRLWRTTALIWTVMLAGGAAVLQVAWGRAFPFWIGGAIVLAYGIFYLTYWVNRAYRAWEFEIRESDVRLRHGVLWHRTSVVPHARIQHVDTRHGPLTRAYGLASIVLYTAGHTGASIEIPGLPMAEAEALRERLGELSGADDAV